MPSDPVRQAPPDVPRLKWRKSSRFAVLEVLAGLIVFALLKALHRSGVLFPTLSRLEFVAVVLGGLLLVAGVAHLLERWWAARAGKPG